MRKLKQEINENIKKTTGFGYLRRNKSQPSNNFFYHEIIKKAERQLEREKESTKTVLRGRERMKENLLILLSKKTAQVRYAVCGER